MKTPGIYLTVVFFFNILSSIFCQERESISSIDNLSKQYTPFRTIKKFISRDDIDLNAKAEFIFSPEFSSMFNGVYIDSIMALFKTQVIKECYCDNPELAGLLSDLFIADQKTRKEAVHYEKVKKYDSADSLRVITRHNDSIIQNTLFPLIDSLKSFPDSKTVGSFGLNTIFLVIQHSHSQKKYYPYLKILSEKGELKKSTIALMEDRINMTDDRPQKFGSQLKQLKDDSGNYISGKYIPYLVQSLDSINIYRRDVGLDSIENYWKKWNISINDYKSFYNK